MNNFLEAAKLIVALLLAASLTSPSPASAATMGWDAVPGILARIKAPTFPARDFPITHYGATADGADCTEAIRQAIDACSVAHGGRVVVPPGVFFTGAVHLKSNVNLYVSEGATLKFLTDPAKYLPMVLTRWEGTKCLNYSPFIYALDQQNIAVTGKGILDGSASAGNWWAMLPLANADRVQLSAMGDSGIPVAQRVFGAGHYLRPYFIQPYRCRNVLIEGVTIHNSPMWEINPELCTNVIVRGVTIESHGPNNDGCDPESSKDVLIENCIFDTGDDCIAIKSGRNNDGRRIGVASENLIIRHCTMKDGHGGVVIGSEISGDCRNVFAENCRMDSPNLQRVLRFKSNARRGGVLENVFLRNITVGQVAEAILTVDFRYEEGANGPYRPIVRNVSLENITSAKSPRVMWIAGFPGATIDGIRFRNCTFRGVETAEVLQNAGSISLDNVLIEPAVPSRSLSTREAPTATPTTGTAP